MTIETLEELLKDAGAISNQDFIAALNDGELLTRLGITDDDQNVVELLIIKKEG